MSKVRSKQATSKASPHDQAVFVLEMTRPVKPQRALTAEETRRLRTWAVACDAAMRLGTAAARNDANKVARVLGFKARFDPTVDALLAKLRDVFPVRMLEAQKDRERRVKAGEAAPWRQQDTIELAVRLAMHAFRRPVAGVTSKGASDETHEKVWKACSEAIGGAADWSASEVKARALADAVLRATYRALGGAPDQAQKLLRER